MTAGKQSAAKRFARAVDRAHQIDPHRLALTILADSAERRSTLRAASYEAKITVGARSDSAPERMLEHIRGVHPTDRDNFITVDRAVIRCLDAVSELNAECSDRGAAWDPDAWRSDDWDEMLHDAHMLLEPRHHEDCEHRKQCQVTACAKDCPRRTCRCENIIEIADGLDRDVEGPIGAFVRNLTVITKVRRAYSRRAPTKWQQLREAGLTADSVCDPCASIRPPEYHAAAHKERQVCRWYNDLWNRTGERPPRELVRLKHHAPQSEYRKALAQWEDDCEKRRLDELLAEGA